MINGRASRLRRSTAGLSAAVLAATIIVVTGNGAQAGVESVAVRGDVATSGLEWGDCGDPAFDEAGVQCATLDVPLDRRDPGAGTVTLAMARRPATGSPNDRLGSLVFNPGGPGGSGTASLPGLWSALPVEVTRRFDVVSWDPRGVGATVPALEDCAQPWPRRPLTGPVDWTSVITRFQRDLAAANRACARANPGELAHVGTMENVADLDRIRAALGDDKLTYWGLSYGTRIGYVYALTYPDRVRAMVLDGSIDPASTALSLTEGGAAPDQAYGSFANAYPESDRRLTELLAVLDTRTVALPRGQRLDRWVVLDFVYGLVAQQAQYPVIAQFIDTWHMAVFGEGAEQQDAALGGAIGVDFQRNLPNSNAGGVFSVTNCTDYADRAGLGRIEAAVRWEDRLAPRYGASLATMFGLGCAGLDHAPDPVPVITGDGSPVPVLILGASRDGSTIVQWTARMSRAFPNSRTVTYAGGQHVTWGLADSPCVNRIANRYVLELTLPATDRGCPNTVSVAQP